MKKKSVEDNALPDPGPLSGSSDFSPESLRLLFDMSPDLHCIISGSGYIRQHNRSLGIITGYSDEEIKSRLFLDFVHPDDIENTRTEFNKLNAGVESVKFENRFHCSNGTYLWLEWIAWSDRKNNLIICSARDISEKKKSEQENKRTELLFRSIFEKPELGIAIVGKSRKWEKVNQAFCTMTGYTFSEISHMTWDDLTHPDDRKDDIEWYHKIISGEENTYNREKRYITKNGSVLYARINVVCVRTTDGEPDYFITIIQDITRQRAAERELKASQEQFKTLVESTGDGIALIDEKEEFVLGNTAAEEIFEIPAGELAGKSLFDFLLSDQAELVRRESEKRKVGVISTYSVEIRTSANKRKVIQLSATPYFEGEEYKGAYAVFRDVTESNKRINELSESEQLYHSMFDKHSAIMLLFDKNTGSIIDANSTAVSFYGYPEEELRKMKIWDLSTMAPDEAAEIFRDISSGNASYLNSRDRLASGELRDVEVYTSTVHVGKQDVIYAVIHDITSKKESERILAESEFKYRMLAENIRDVIWILNINKGRFTYFSPSVFSLRGYTPAEAAMQSMEEIVSPKHINLIKSTIEEGLKELRDSKSDFVERSLEVQLITKSKEPIWTEINAHFQVNHDGEVEILGVSRNIEERKKVESAVKREHILLRTLIDNLPDAIFLKDIEGRKVLANKADLVAMNVEAECEIVGKTDLEIYSDPSASEGYYEDLKVLGSGLPLLNLETSYIDNTGTEHWIITSKIPLLNELGEISGIIGVCHDITERKRTEARLLEMTEELKKLNSTKDKLFSVIAHDLRGPIGSFIQVLEMITSEIEIKESLKEKLLHELKNSARTTFGLLENLLNWSRSQTNSIRMDPHSFMINQLIDENIELLKPNAKLKHISLTVATKDELSVYADHDSINLVIRNLISNAIKFTNNEGVVSISVRKTENMAEICIQDNGIGMDMEQLNALFKPESFKSTFGTNNEKGSGLGLMLCKDFVEKNGGTIIVESEPGFGSCFRFTIPVE